VHGGPLALADEAALLRREIVDALHACGGGHYGGSLSVIDLLLTLYRRQLRITPATPRHPGRDRLILSKGHAAIAQYAVLRRLGCISQPLGDYGALASPLEGHPT
jgi:transketolase